MHSMQFRYLCSRDRRFQQWSGGGTLSGEGWSFEADSFFLETATWDTHQVFRPGVRGSWTVQGGGFFASYLYGKKFTVLMDHTVSH